MTVRDRDARLSGLYVITDNGQTPADRLGAAVEAAIRGGARIVQYRDKSTDSDRRRREAAALRAVTREYNVLFLVNDDIDLAAQVGADGVHIGREDASLALARERLGASAIIGVSCYDRFDLAQLAVEQGADYVAFGAFFPSRIKPNAPRATIDLLIRAHAELPVPVCAIGGITIADAPSLIRAGADMLAVISAVFSAENIEQAARELAGLFDAEHSQS